MPSASKIERAAAPAALLHFSASINVRIAVFVSVHFALVAAATYRPM